MNFTQRMPQWKDWGMERDTKLGYGFLLVGAAMPYLIDRFFHSPLAALIVAIVFFVVGVIFLVLGHLHQLPDHAPISSRRRLFTWILGIIVIGGICFQGWKVSNQRQQLPPPPMPTPVVIQWNDPAPITVGTPLSSTQLNATSNVPATPSYDPDFREVLAVGTHTLTVTFTPLDTAKYATAKKTVTLVVNQALPQTPNQQAFVVHFKDSSLLTKTRQDTVTREFNQSYLFLKNLGLAGPKDLPPVGIDNAPSGAKMSFTGDRPMYYDSINLSSGQIDDVLFLRRTYMYFAISEALHEDDGRSRGDDRPLRWQGSLILSNYFASTSLRKIDPERTAREYWQKALWAVRQKCGGKLGDSIVVYAVKKWGDYAVRTDDQSAEPQSLSGMDSYLYYWLRQGAETVDNNEEHFPCWDSAIRSFVKLPDLSPSTPHS